MLGIPLDGDKLVSYLNFTDFKWTIILIINFQKITMPIYIPISNHVAINESVDEYQTKLWHIYKKKRILRNLKFFKNILESYLKRIYFKGE